MKTTTILALVVMAILMSMGVSAAVTCAGTWDTPAATAATVTGTATFNLTVACDSPVVDLGNVSKVFFEYKLTTASTWTAMNASNCSNTSEILGVKGGLFRTNFDTKQMYDSGIYQIRATGYNATTAILSDTTLAAIYADNHNPATPVIVTDISSNEYVNFPATFVVNAFNASSCVVDVYSTETAYVEKAGTISGSTGAEQCSYTFVSADWTEGTKRYVTFVSSDLGSSPDTASVTLDNIQFVKSTSAARGAIIDADLEQTAAAEAAASQPNLGTIAFAGAAIYGAYWLLRKKKMI